MIYLCTAQSMPLTQLGDLPECIAETVLILNDAMKLIAEYSPSGRAVGTVENLDHLVRELRSRSDDFDAIAISSIIRLPSRKLHAQYFESFGAMINPWGGVEAIFTHALAAMLNVRD